VKTDFAKIVFMETLIVILMALGMFSPIFLIFLIVEMIDNDTDDRNE